MIKQNLILANELTELIQVTETALNEIVKFHSKKTIDDIKLRDSNYWLTICEHSDGSGIKLNLTRYYGNTSLIKLIEDALRVQLKEFEDKFEKL